MRARKRKDYNELIQGYQGRLKQAERRLHVTTMKVVRIGRLIARYNEEIRTQKRRIDEAATCLASGYLYPELKKKKKKVGRRIEID